MALHRPRLGLRTRLLLIGVTGVALALLVGGIGFYQALRVSTDRTLDREALSSAREVAALVDEGRLPDALPTSGAQLVQVVDARQRVLAASLGADRLVPVLDPAELRAALDGEAVLVDGAAFGSAGPLRVRAVAAGPADAPVSVIVAVQVGDVLAARRALRAGLLVVFPAVLLVMAAVAWVVMGRTLRPVEALRAGAERIGAPPSATGPERDREARLPVPAPADEIRALALTLNGMLDRLAAARDRQRSFVADAAHELRSPLASMRVQLEVAQRLGEGGDLPAELAPDLERLSALVEDLLLLARSGADSPVPAHPERVEVGALLAELAADVPGRDGVRVAAAEAAGLAVHADPGELRRVLLNLTSNAVRHAASRVDLDAVAEPDGRVLLRVSDDGPGIPAADRERVFQRFARLDDARGRDAGGSGLGLPIAAELVARSGGTIALTDAPGGGLRAEVRLPVAR
ncbi:sensor histidine kinase [Microlunatus flavus]|uniref:histidine kinase n=1 Tax=Microlunatus flavus TaxID=1036181 RepID=A0A1H9MEI9_9ACTN|nr:HAMP domain-containing sensor histidine kinase [Microlunatus flavus]SER21857.1 Signal transduction histidine kinase [Microlunatus flavus]